MKEARCENQKKACDKVHKYTDNLGLYRAEIYNVSKAH